jgi:hypothetical protein
MTNQKDDDIPADGEGNHEADRQYREATKRFIDSGRVGDAAREAQRAVKENPDELEAAEEEGRSHIAEEDPEVSKRG